MKEYINGRWSSRKKVNIYNDDGTIQSFDDDPPPSPSSPNISTPTAKPGLKKISTMARLDPFNLFSARISTTSVDLDDGQKGWDKKVQDVRDLRDRLRENDESLEDDEIYEQLEFERSNPIGGFIQYWLSQMVQGIANILLSVLMPTILTSLFWTGIIVGAPMSLLFADYLSLKSIPVCAYQMCKAALPALVGYFVSGVTLYYLYLNFIATLEDGICVQYNDDKFQSSMIMVFFASVVPGFPELWTQLMIALYADTFLYKSKGVFYRVKVPNDITFRLRVCFFPVIDLGIFAWLLMAGTLYVLASSDPTSLVQAGCAIIFVAEIDKMYFNAYVRGRTRSSWVGSTTSIPFSTSLDTLYPERWRLSMMPSERSNRGGRPRLIRSKRGSFPRRSPASIRLAYLYSCRICPRWPCWAVSFCLISPSTHCCSGSNTYMTEAIVTTLLSRQPCPPPPMTPLLP